MLGAMLSNILWAKLSYKGLNKLITILTNVMFLIAISLAFIGGSLYIYLIIFFIVGASIDGNRISSQNLILILAPEDKRAVYNALQTNIVSFGIFFSILGGLILTVTNYTFLYSLTIILLAISLIFSFYLEDEKIN
jgi:MFS family permease